MADTRDQQPVGSIESYDGSIGLWQQIEISDVTLKASTLRRHGRIDAIKKIIAFFRRKAVRLGVQYPGTYSNLNQMSVRVTQHYREEADWMAKSASNPDVTSLGHRIVYFTDGSLNGDKKTGGAGVAFKHLSDDMSLGSRFDWAEHRVAVGGIQEIRDAEMLAIFEAVKLAVSEIRSSRRSTQSPQSEAPFKPRIFIFTDSTSCLEILEPYLRAKQKDRENQLPYLHPVFVGLLQHLSALVSWDIKVGIHWVKGHSGLDGNSRADKLARESAQWFRQHPWVRDPQDPLQAFYLPERTAVRDVMTVAAVYTQTPQGEKRKAGEMQSYTIKRRRYKPSIDTRPTSRRLVIAKRTKNAVKGLRGLTIKQELHRLPEMFPKNEVMANASVHFYR